MLGEPLGRRRRLPVQVAQVGAAGGAAIEDEEEVGRAAEDGLAEGVPVYVAYWAVGFAGRVLVSYGSGEFGGESRECFLLFLHEVAVLHGSAVGRTRVAVGQGGVELCSCGLGPRFVVWVFVTGEVERSCQSSIIRRGREVASHSPAKHKLIVVIQASMSVVIHDQEGIITRIPTKLPDLAPHALRRPHHGNEVLVHFVAIALKRPPQPARLVLEAGVVTLRWCCIIGLLEVMERPG